MNREKQDAVKAIDRAETWQKGDDLTAQKLNTATGAINDLLDVLGEDDPQSGSTQKSDFLGIIGYEEMPPNPYQESTKAFWRHNPWGTADLRAGEEIGVYATPPTIESGIGALYLDYTPNPANKRNLIPSYEIKGDSPLEHGAQVFLAYETTEKGAYIEGSAHYTSSIGTIYPHGLNAGSGSYCEPVAKIIKNPQFEKELIAMEYNGPKVPILADDASFTPTTAPRETQGTKNAECLDENIVPIRGLNNHGGLKILEPDLDGNGRISNAVQVEVEMYGKAGLNYEGSGYPTGIQGLQTIQPYNERKPYKTSGDGLLACWPVKMGGIKTGEISLIGTHAEPWQLIFQGTGEINIPTHSIIDSVYAELESRFAEGYTVFVEHSFDVDYKYAFAKTDNGLFVQELTRYSEFGLNSQGALALKRGQFVESQTMFFEFLHTHYVEILTLDDPESTVYQSAFLGDLLRLVQVPIFGGSRYVEGHSILDSGYVEPIITGYRLI